MNKITTTFSSLVAVGRFFNTPLVDLGLKNQSLAGIVMPEPEVGLQRIGITDQFLAHAETYSAKYSNEGHFAQLFCNAFAALGGIPEGGTVLDVGTGSGINTIGPLLAQLPGCTIVATDLSPDLLRLLRKFVVTNRLDDRVFCVCTDAMRNHFEPATFDLVVGAAILHHLLDPIEALRAAHRTLKPGGMAIWFEPFEPGVRMVRFLYKLILGLHEKGQALDRRVVAAFRALILDADTRAGLDRDAPHFKQMDDKWLFTRTYIERAAIASGFESVNFVPHAAHGRLYRDIIRIELKMIGDIPDDALPRWAWELVDLADANFTDDAKRDMPHEATIIMRKAKL